MPGDDLRPRKDPAVRHVLEDRSPCAGLELEPLDLDVVLEFAHCPRVFGDRPPGAHLLGEEIEGTLRCASNRHRLADRLDVSLSGVGGTLEWSASLGSLRCCQACRPPRVGNRFLPYRAPEPTYPRAGSRCFSPPSVRLAGRSRSPRRWSSSWCRRAGERRMPRPR